MNLFPVVDVLGVGGEARFDAILRSLGTDSLAVCEEECLALAVLSNPEVEGDIGDFASLSLILYLARQSTTSSVCL